MLQEMLTGMAADKLKELQDDPAKHKELEEASVAILDMATELLKVSPEFRRAFARVHTEFFKYPESKETVQQIETAQGGV